MSHKLKKKWFILENCVLGPILSKSQSKIHEKSQDKTGWFEKKNIKNPVSFTYILSIKKYVCTYSRIIKSITISKYAHIGLLGNFSYKAQYLLNESNMYKF